jgi:hypothetical protein
VATTPLTIGPTYAKAVDTAVAAFTLQVTSEQGAEVVFVAAAPDESLTGAILRQYEAVTRGTATGHVYWRVPAMPGRKSLAGAGVLLV